MNNLENKASAFSILLLCCMTFPYLLSWGIHHCLSHFIFLKKNPHTVFNPLCFMQNWFFFLVLGKWRPTLMKPFPQSPCYCWSRPEQSSELSQIRAHRPCWVRERVSAGRLHLYTWHPCTAICLPFSCRCPRCFPVTSVWREQTGGGVSLKFTQLGAHLLQHLCSPFSGSAASHRPVLVKFYFSFTGFFNDWNQR